MESLKNYWWMIVTIPGLAFIIYMISQQIITKDKTKKMFGMSILAILFGVFQIFYFVLNKEQLNVAFLFFGICWIILGAGRLIYDYKKSLKE